MNRRKKAEKEFAGGQSGADDKKTISSTRNLARKNFFRAENYASASESGLRTFAPAKT